MHCGSRNGWHVNTCPTMRERAQPSAEPQQFSMGDPHPCDMSKDELERHLAQPSAPQDDALLVTLDNWLTLLRDSDAPTLVESEWPALIDAIQGARDRLVCAQDMLNRAKEREAELERALAEREQRAKKLETVLLLLDERGGLGHDKHRIIKATLGVPYPEFCHHAAKCMSLGSCPREICCAD